MSRTENIGEECRDIFLIYTEFVMHRRTWIKVRKSAGWGVKKFHNIEQWAEQSRKYRKESYWHMVQIYGADGASMYAGQSSTKCPALAFRKLNNV